jgi:hypothetical protein
MTNVYLPAFILETFFPPEVSLIVKPGPTVPTSLGAAAYAGAMASTPSANATSPRVMRFMIVSLVGSGLWYPTVSYTTVRCDRIYVTDVRDDLVQRTRLQFPLLDPQAARELGVAQPPSIGLCSRQVRTFP